MRIFSPVISFVFLLLLSVSAQAGFSFTEEDGKLSLHEDGDPVFVYNVEMLNPPADVDQERYRRMGYLHPVYNVDGQVVTEDFPKDHYHHRGVFWGWPHTASDGRDLNVWEMDSGKQYFDRWISRETSRKEASFSVQNHWAFVDAPEVAVVEETVTITAHKAEKKSRSIDFQLRFTNVSGKPFTFLGATNKGYGGFNFRPIKDNKPFHLYTALGPLAEDSLNIASPWADISWDAKDDQKAAGVAIFQHPSNPDYPHFGWILRHYGFNGAAWPHLDEYTLPAGESLELQYRLVVHTGDAEDAKVEKLFKKFEKKAK